VRSVWGVGVVGPGVVGVAVPAFAVVNAYRLAAVGVCFWGSACSLVDIKFIFPFAHRVLKDRAVKSLCRPRGPLPRAPVGAQKVVFFCSCLGGFQTFDAAILAGDRERYPLLMSFARLMQVFFFCLRKAPSLFLRDLFDSRFRCF